MSVPLGVRPDMTGIRNPLGLYRLNPGSWKHVGQDLTWLLAGFFV